MRHAWAGSLGALLVIALTVSALLRDDPLEYSPTSYGTLPGAYGALHDTFARLDLGVKRSFAAPDRLDPRTTVWWIEPHEICAKLAAEDADGAAVTPDWDPAPWLRAGGTAVLFSAGLAHCAPPARIADLGLPVPRRPEPAEPEAGNAPDEPGPAASADGEAIVVDGTLAPLARALPIPNLARFEEVPPGFAVAARADGAPFVLEAPLGAGRLVLVADGRFLANRWLDQGDAAALAFDLARAYGVPQLDEREHGLSDTPATLAYLVGSPALPVFLGLAAAGSLFAWAGASLPRRRVGEERPSPPTLRTYVDSLARLSARAGDHGEVFERYREFARARLRSALGLAHDAPFERIEQRLGDRPGVRPEDLAALRGEVAVAGRGELERACRAVDRLLAEVR